MTSEANEKTPNKERTLDEEIAKALRQYYDEIAESNYTEDDLIAENYATKQIKQLCFRARDKWVLGEIEKLDAYDGIYDMGEDDYGRHHSKNMGDAVLIDDIRKLLTEGKGREDK